MPDLVGIFGCFGHLWFAEKFTQLTYFHRPEKVKLKMQVTEFEMTNA
jgi:hypothetical protein